MGFLSVNRSFSAVVVTFVEDSPVGHIFGADIVVVLTEGTSVENTFSATTVTLVDDPSVKNLISVSPFCFEVLSIENIFRVEGAASRQIFSFGERI